MFVLPVSDSVALRECTPNDAVELFALVETNRVHLREWLPWLDDTTRLQHIEQFLRESRRRSDRGSGQTFMITAGGRIVGVLGQHYVDRVDNKTELGYWLDQEHQGTGLMTRAVGRMLRHIFDDLDLNRVVLHCAAENRRSRAVPERLGFRLEGVLREAQWLYTRYVDLAIYGLLRDEWRNPKI
jgi:ribosomal-protein-serine acetyltransferase